MESTIASEIRARTTTVISEMISEVFSKRMELAKIRFALETKEKELNRRADRIAQQEVFLSEGQKLLKSVHPELRLQDPMDINMRVLRDDVASELHSKYQSAQAKLNAKREELQIREEELSFRAGAWKAQARAELTDELRSMLEAEFAQEKGKIGEEAYNEGLEVGKEIGRQEAQEEIRQKGFVEGYKAAREAQKAMMALKSGKIAHDSPELDFLFDEEHPKNPFRLGMQIGSGQIGSGQVTSGPSVEAEVANANQ
jgi:hypothetical protein